MKSYQAMQKYLKLFSIGKSDITYCQKKYFAQKLVRNEPRPVFDRTSKQIQKNRAAAASDVSTYEYLKEEVRKGFAF